MAEPMTLTHDIIHSWADGKDGPVALHLKQKLVPVEEGEHAVVFPPTYADIGYNIDALSDGTKVVTIDSVGSQANRIEPIFEEERYSALVPQIEIEIEIKPNKKDKEDEPYIVRRSLLDLAHRSADATVYASPTLGPEIRKAFRALNRRNDAGPLCRLAPTSLLFGVWDSRGGSGEKCPRIVRSIIRAWNVDLLHAAAQFNSIKKTLDDDTLSELKKVAKEKKKKLSDVGLDDAPAVFRRLKGNASKEIPEYRNGYPNPERRVLGGVLVQGSIERDVTINLVALRRLEGKNDNETQAIRHYLLSLALVAATADFDLYLREGCHLRLSEEDKWQVIPRRGDLSEVDLSSEGAIETAGEYAKVAVEQFRGEFTKESRRGFDKDWPEQLEKRVHKFDLAAAKNLIATAETEEAAGES
jgi:CRISPR-associated protein Csb1